MAKFAGAERYAIASPTPSGWHSNDGRIGIRVSSASDSNRQAITPDLRHAPFTVQPRQIFSRFANHLIALAPRDRLAWPLIKPRLRQALEYCQPDLDELAHRHVIILRSSVHNKHQGSFRYIIV
ncbi:hypothetical protein [Mesorhizobium hawassense]|uniref:hypothetical protein n=1 Tax=Mesorhizobium hawassense TaxID=1209954 RepID=UPI0011BD46A7|nr:hypothetical protein [Mesorhizobium hawassense]